MKRISIKKTGVVVGALLVIFGAAGSLPALYFHLTNHGTAAPIMPTVAAAPLKKTPAEPVSGQPVSISIPSLGINLPIIDGYYNQRTRQWTLTPDKAQFAAQTVLPNNISGETFIYGHEIPKVFGGLYKIKPGAEAIITTSNGHSFTYTYTNTYAAQPTDVSVMQYQGPPLLIVQTCSGLWYQNRQMYLFNLKSYSR